MILFEFRDPDAALRFYQACMELGAKTERERTEILLDFAKNGEIRRMQQTNRTKAQLIEDWSEHYNVKEI